MAIRAGLVDLMRLERTTSSLQGTLSPIEIQTLIWWARLVSIQLLPKETGLQPAAVADLLLTHIIFILFLANPVYLIGASVQWKHFYLRSCTEVPPTTGYVIFIVP